MPSRQPQAGSTLIWLFLWIAGTAAIAYWCATRHVPAVQQQIQVNAEAAVSGVVASDVTTTVYGRTVTLEGSVADEIQKTDLLNALSTADGVRHINTDGLTVIGSVAAVSESPVAPTTDSSDQPSVSETSNAESPEQPSAPVAATDTPSSNEPLSQNDGQAEEASDAPTTELPTAQAPASDTPGPSAPDTPSENQSPVVAPANESPAPETPTAQEPSPPVLTAELTPPAPPSPPTPTSEVPSAQTLSPVSPTPAAGPAESPSSATPTPEVPSAETLSPESPTPEAGPTQSPSPATPTPENLSAEAPSPVSPTNNSPNGPGPADALTDENTQPSAVELAELAVANEPAPSDLSDAPSPEAADASPALVDVLDEEASTFSMQIKDGTLTLTGDISSEDDSLAFIQSAMRTFDVNYLVNSVQVSEENAKASWLPALTEFIPSLQPVSDASITIVESQITLSGTAPDRQTHDKITDDALSQLSELSLVDSIVVSSDEPTPAAAAALEPQAAATTEPSDTPAQTGLTSQQTQSTAAEPNAETTTTTAAELSTLREAFKALEAEKILFESGSDVLTDESIQTVAAMSALLAKYTDINIEIDGHTDSAGSSDSNLQLSQLRANAVRDLMIERGIARERLSAYGFGDGVPIADNGTADGRKLNRRIEFNF